MLICDYVPRPRAIMNLRMVSKSNDSPNQGSGSVVNDTGPHGGLPELRLVLSTDHINKGTADSIAGTIQLLDYMANRLFQVESLHIQAINYEALRLYSWRDTKVTPAKHLRSQGLIITRMELSSHREVKIRDSCHTQNRW